MTVPKSIAARTAIKKKKERLCDGQRAVQHGPYTLQKDGSNNELSSFNRFQKKIQILLDIHDLIRKNQPIRLSTTGIAFLK